MDAHSVTGWEVDFDAGFNRGLGIAMVNFVRDLSCGGVQEDVDASEVLDRDRITGELNGFCAEVDEFLRANGRWVARKENDSADSGGSGSGARASSSRGAFLLRR